MQSSGTSTPAGDSPGSGRAFPRKADFTPEIAPPRLRRTTYPAGQSPLVLPGLTRASSSFTITSNHQNILPLWPAAPPPGQPVVFFVRCPWRPSGLPFFSPVAWSAQGAGQACTVSWQPALPDTRQGRRVLPLCVPVFDGAAALRCPATEPGQQGRAALRVRGGLPIRLLPGSFWQARCHRLAPSVRSTSLAMIPHRRAVTAGTVRCLPQEFAVPLLPILLSYCGDAVRCPPAVWWRAGRSRAGRIACGSPAHKKTSTGMETGGRLVLFQGRGAQDQNSL